MDINSVDVERIVKQVLADMNGSAPKKAFNGEIPKTSKAAMLTALEKYEKAINEKEAQEREKLDKLLEDDQNTAIGRDEEDSAQDN